VLDQGQRDAILRRHGGFIQTYFSRMGLRRAEFAPAEKIPEADKEFYNYLRLSTVLFGGAELCGLLDRVVQAPATQQVYYRTTRRGGLSGRLDPAAYARQFGQRTGTPTFPVRAVLADHLVDENVLAASCAQGVLSELQDLLRRIRLPPSSEHDVAGEVAHLLDLYLKDPALNGVVWASPTLNSDEFADLAARVAERWQTRRISNLSYFELLSWAANYLRPSLPDTGAFGGLVYSEDFDDRLFELFVVACLRESLSNMGFDETEVRPLHMAGSSPVLELHHRDAGLGLSLFYQRGSRVVWSEAAPREWTFRGIPDIAVKADSSTHPVVLVDAKNRRRSTVSDEGEGEEGIRASEELYKMLGYFHNFANTMVVEGRGPVGGLVFQCRGAKPPSVEYASRSGTGLLLVDAWDPMDEQLTAPEGAVDDFVKRLLEWAGLLGGRRPDGYDARDDLEEVYGIVGSEETTAANVEDTEELLQQLNALHDYARKRYWENRGPALLRAERDLEAHLLGGVWGDLSDDEQQFLATAEVFWRDHRKAIGMDFAPVVIELAKSVESVLARLFIKPFQDWTTATGKRSGKLDTLGDLRAELQRAVEVHEGTEKPGRGARVLDEYLGLQGLRGVAYELVLPVASELNGPRRAAAHPYVITSRAAEAFRAGVLGVGGATPVLARLVAALA
jgi:hypothetical protein